MEEIVGTTLRQGSQSVSLSVLMNEGIEFYGIYFGAHWAPPCRLFTPALSDFYKSVNDQD
jgi:hypothetical protein